MRRDDNKTDYFGFLSHPTLNGTGFGLTVIGFLAGLGLFSQIRDESKAGLGIFTLDLPRLYF